MFLRLSYLSYCVCCNPSYFPEPCKKSQCTSSPHLWRRYRYMRSFSRAQAQRWSGRIVFGSEKERTTRGSLRRAHKQAVYSRECLRHIWFTMYNRLKAPFHRTYYCFQVLSSVWWLFRLTCPVGRTCSGLTCLHSCHLGNNRDIMTRTMPPKPDSKWERLGAGWLATPQK